MTALGKKIYSKEGLFYDEFPSRVKLALSVNGRIRKKKRFPRTEHIPEGLLRFLPGSYDPPRKAVFPSIACSQRAQG